MWPNPQFLTDLVTFTEEILNKKVHFLCGLSRGIKEAIFSFGEKYLESNNWDALHDLVPFAQFKKIENHPWRSVTFSNVAGWSLQRY